MYRTSNAYRRAIREASNLSWRYTLKANGSQIDESGDNMLTQGYKQSVLHMPSLSVGNVVSQYINLTLRGTSFALTDSVIEPTFTLDGQNVPMGKFNVLGAPQVNLGNTEIVAYDNVKKLDKAYSTALNYPATIRQVVDEVATLCGVIFDPVGLPTPQTEYYLSTSKTTPTGGSWATTKPTWTTGMYIWTRTKLTYINPSSVKYTEPYCDDSCDALMVNRNYFAIKNITKSTSLTISSGVYSASDGDTNRVFSLKVQQFTNAESFISNSQTNRANIQAGNIVFLVSTVLTGCAYIRISNNGTSREFDLRIPLPTGFSVGDKFVVSLDLLDNTVGACKFKNVKIDKGETATAYKPAQEDTVLKVMYGTSFSQSTEPSSWIETPPTLSASQFLWQKTVATLGDGTTKESTPQCIAGLCYPDIQIPKAYTYEKCSQVMSEICKLMGCNLLADRTGNLMFKWFNPCGVTYPYENHYSQALNEADYTLGKLSCSTSNGIITSGTENGTMAYKSDLMTQTQLNAILTADAITYRGGEIEIAGDPSLDPWDVIAVTDAEDTSHNMPVMYSLLEFDGAMKNSISAYSSTENETEFGESQSGSRKIMEIQKSIDGIVVNLQDNYQDNTQLQATLQATAEDITAQVEQTVIPTAISNAGIYSLSISSDTGSAYTDEAYSKTLTAKVIQADTNITDNLRTRCFKWTRKSTNADGDKLWNLNPVYGKTLTLTETDYDDNCTFICDVSIVEEVDLADKSGTVITDKSGTAIKALRTTHTLHAEMPLVESFKQYRTMLQLLKDKAVVSVEGDGSLAEVNLETGESGSSVLIKGDQISLEGNVTANDNVKFNEDGSMECNKGKFNDNVQIKDKLSIYSKYTGTGYTVDCILNAITTAIVQQTMSSKLLQLIIGQPDNTVLYEGPDDVDLYAGGVYIKGQLTLDEDPFVTSDREAKDDFTDLDERYYNLAEEIQIKMFTYKHGKSGRFHIGIVAQEFETLLEKHKIDAKECAILGIDAEGKRSIRYGELYALMSWYQQEKSKHLEKRISAIEERMMSNGI